MVQQCTDANVARRPRDLQSSELAVGSPGAVDLALFERLNAVQYAPARELVTSLQPEGESRGSYRADRDQ
jgi:hypothetical protein